VAGYICYGPTPVTEGTWDIYWEAVAHERQGLGIGSKLMAAVLQEIREAGAVWRSSKLPASLLTKKPGASMPGWATKPWPASRTFTLPAMTS